MARTDVSATVGDDTSLSSYLDEANLSRCRTNHNIGMRVNYLKCAVAGCPYQCRLLENINFGGVVPQCEIEIASNLAHNHQAVVARDRGLTFAQKAIIRLCIERGQAAPKNVRLHVDDIIFTAIVDQK